MAQPTPIELVEKLRVAETIPEMARIVAALLNSCGICGYKQIGYELARMSVTGLGRE
jgi:hypothetical protein